MARASKKKAVVLLSGGLDSATALAIARSEGFETYALSFRYGQRHVIELECARRVASALGARDHVVVEFDLRPVRRLGAHQRYRGAQGSTACESPKEYRSRMFRPATPSSLRSRSPGPRCWRHGDMFFGANAVDYSGYPDCRPEYVGAFESMANLATKAGVEGTQRVEIHTPLIRLDQSADHCRRPRARRRLCADLQLLRSGVRRRSVRQVRRLPVAGEGIRRDREARSAPRQIRAGVGGAFANGLSPPPASH